MHDEIDRLRSWMYEALNSLGDPQDACDHGDSKEAALRATIDEAIGKLRTGLASEQSGEVDRLRTICASAVAKLDTMQVCCRETECDRAAGRWDAERDSSCDLREVRGLIAAYERKAPRSEKPSEK